MKMRLIAAAVLLPILLLIVLVAPKIVAAVVFGLLLAIAAYELLYRTRLVLHVRLVFYSAIMAFSMCMWSYFGGRPAHCMLCILVFMMILFSEMMLDHVRVRFEMICMCLVAGFLIPYLLSSIIRILALPLGRYLVLIPFVVAFVSDAGAYFVGRRFGKHKLSPVVSPNKTLEGSLGGIAAAIIGMIIYVIVLHVLKFRVNYGLAILYGFLGSIAGSFGDLCFSVIKRQTGLKDYGNLIPGHGGVLDRFDSMVMVAPLIEALLTILPVAV